MLHDGELPGAASLGPHVIGVSSMSKNYGVSGLRVGWITTTNKELQDLFLAAKQIISITGGALDETLAEQILANESKLRGPIMADIKFRLDLVDSWVQSEAEMLEWVRPVAGAIGFLRVKREPGGGMEAFYERLRKKYRVFLMPGTCFVQPDTFFRLGFAYTSLEQLKDGLAAISAALRE